MSYPQLTNWLRRTVEQPHQVIGRDDIEAIGQVAEFHARFVQHISGEFRAVLVSPRPM